MSTAAPASTQRQMSPGVLHGIASEPTPEQQVLRTAMLSVYYHSIGRRFEIRGAPAVLLPPQIQPQSLREALTTIRREGPAALLRQALWTIVRAVGPARGAPQPDEDVGLERYPREILDAISDDQLKSLKLFERDRGRYRREAHLFGAALLALTESDGGGDGFTHILRLFGEAGKGGGSFNQATARARVLGGETAEDFLKSLEGKDRPKTAASLLRLEHEVGLSLPTFIEEFADSVGFAERFLPSSDDVLTIFPTSSVTVQDADSLLTRVTVTALVTTDNFHCLRIGLDPQCWAACSTAFESTKYLADPFVDTAPDPLPDPGHYDYVGPDPPRKPPHHLDEDVTITWGSDESRIASFHNVLNITRFDIEPREQKIDLEFNLHRCIKSRILWDERAGGILVDEGYAKARRLGTNLWRLTVRKTLRFSDRTPYVGGVGWNDFGQILNYLAPSMLSWWIESEMYSTTCPAILELARKRAAEKPATTAANVVDQAGGQIRDGRPV